ncbi:MAG: hypothetical protein KKB51_24350 [Candidatus Riflebacteria bacterium]|nr:hypothetical protein [Candidatus Riflebacteria bacterium]
MKLFQKNVLFAAAFVLSIGLTGCIDKVLFPEAHFTVVSVTPDKLRATITETVSTTGVTTRKAKIPTTVVTLNSDFKIPADMVSFSISYTTKLGEPIAAAEVLETPYHLSIPVGGSITIPMNPYNTRLYTLLEFTSSDISPVNAKMVITIKDANGNKVKLEANCLCYATWDEVESS